MTIRNARRFGNSVYSTSVPDCGDDSESDDTNYRTHRGAVYIMWS